MKMVCVCAGGMTRAKMTTYICFPSKSTPRNPHFQKESLKRVKEYISEAGCALAGKWGGKEEGQSGIVQ